jgi:DNA polymerase III delta prime subunit
MEIETLSDFVGNQESITKLRQWIKNIMNDPKTNKRVCFLTGPVGSGKTILAKLILKEFHFRLREFDSSDLRTKSNRNLLFQTLGFRDVLAIIRHENNFKKGVLIEDLENLGLATQEVYRKIKSMIQKKKTIGIPIIFTGLKNFKGKKPLSSVSTFIHLKKKSEKEIKSITQKCIHFFQNKTHHPLLEKIANDQEEQQKIIEKSGGDIRRIVNYIKHIADHTHLSTIPHMDYHESPGPSNTLYRLLNLQKDRNITKIYHDMTTEGVVVPFGLHWCYLDYLYWLWKRKGRSDASYNEACRLVSSYFTLYGSFLDAERMTQFWSLKEIGTLLLGWGYRVETKKILQGTYCKKKSVIKTPGHNWWEELESNKISGDTPVETPCMNKTLRGSLHAHQFQNLSLSFIEKNIGHMKAWKPGDVTRRTVELCQFKKKQFSNKERIIKLMGFHS